MNTTYFKNVIMGNVFRTATGTPIPMTYYIGLSSTAPTAAGGNVTEPAMSGSGYTRVQLTSLTAPEDGVINNSSAVSFPKVQQTGSRLLHRRNTMLFMTHKPVATYLCITSLQHRE